MIIVFILYAILAATFTIGKALLVFLPPIFLTAVRMSIAGILLLMSWKVFEKKSKSFNFRDLYWLPWFAMVHILIPYTFEFIALEKVAPSCAALMFNLTPFFSALFSYIYFHERMTLQKWFGFLIGLGGINWFLQPNYSSFYCFNIQGAYVLLSIAVLSGAFGWVYFKKLVQSGYSPLQINGIAMLIAGMQSFLLSYVFAEQVIFVWDKIYEFVLLLSSIILLANFIFYNLYGYLLKRYTVTLLAFIGCVTPLFTAIYDWLWFGIAVDQNFFLSIVIVSCGIYIFYQEELRQGYITSK